VVDNFNRTGGIDTRLVFYKDWLLDAHAAGTQSPGEPGGNSDVGASLSYRSKWVEGKFERRKIGRKFNPEVGFIELTDGDQTNGDLTLKARPAITGVCEMPFEGFIVRF